MTRWSLFLQTLSLLHHFLGLYFVFLDHWVEAVDSSQSISIGMANADRIMVLLSFFVGIGFYRIPIVKKWVLTEPGISKRFQLGFHSRTPYPTAMPGKGKQCRLGKSVQVDRRDPRSTPVSIRGLRLPNDARKLFRAFKKLSQADQEVFFGAAALYHIGLTAGRDFPSLRLSYQVAAVEAVAEPDKPRLEGFVALVGKYNSQLPEEFVRGLYGSIRSAHFHGGRFPLGEYEPLIIGHVMGADRASQIDLQIHTQHVLQPTLIDWLLERSRSN